MLGWQQRFGLVLTPGSRRRLVAALAVPAALLFGGCGEPPTASREPEPTIPPLQQPPQATPTSSAPKQAAFEAQGRRRTSDRSRGATSSADSLRQSFETLQRRFGEVGLVAGPLGRTGRPLALGNLLTGEAWSTIKVPIAARTMQDAGGPGALSASQRTLIGRALTASDNAAAASLWEGLGGGSEAGSAVQRTLRAGGDDTAVSLEGRDGFSPYGQTTWSLRNQERWMAAFAASCVTSPPVTGAILEDMNEVVADQRWGLGTAAPARFKGGWGPGTDGRYLVRQFGVLESARGESAIAIAIAARTPDGSFESGAEALTEVAAWARDNLDVSELPPTGC